MILKGKDAERFLKKMKEAENQVLTPEEKERIQKNYESMLKILKNSKL